MKSRQLVKKLSFKKVTVANLGTDVMRDVRGGAETNELQLCSEYSYCEETCTCHLSGDPNCLDTGIQCTSEGDNTKDYECKLSMDNLCG